MLELLKVLPLFEQVEDSKLTALEQYIDAYNQFWYEESQATVEQPSGMDANFHRMSRENCVVR